MARLSSIMETSNFVLISAVVDKARLSRSEGATSNPYHIALGICLEAMREFLAEKGQDRVKTHVVVECRGKKEDAELELEFRRICDGDNPGNRVLPFDVVFADKAMFERVKATGVLSAELVGRLYQVAPEDVTFTVYDAGLAFKDALRRATVAGSLACLKPGAQPSIPFAAAVDAEV